MYPLCCAICESSLSQFPLSLPPPPPPSGENAELKSCKDEAKHLRRENAILTRRLQTIGEASTHSDDSLEKVGGASGSSPKLLSAAKKSKKESSKGGGEGGGGGGGGGRFGGNVLTVSSEDNGFEAVTMSPDERGKSHTMIFT